MRQVASAVLLLAAACAQKPAPPARDVTQAMRRCQEGLALILLAKDAKADHFADYAEACLDLHAEAACRDGWRAAAAAAPDQRTALLVHACAPAYCAKLATPKPAPCLAPEASVTEAWPELYRAILRHDLPMPQGEKLASLLVELYRPARPPPLVALQIRPRQEGGWLVQLEQDRAREVSVPLTAEDVEAMADRMAALASPATGACVVRAQVGLPASQLEPILKALRTKGFRDVALELVPAPP